MEVEKLSWWSADQSDGSRERGAGSGGGGGMGRRRDTPREYYAVPEPKSKRRGTQCEAPMIPGSGAVGRRQERARRKAALEKPQQRRGGLWQHESRGGGSLGYKDSEGGPAKAEWSGMGDETGVENGMDFTANYGNKQEVDGMSVAHEKWAKPGPGAVHQAPESRDAATSIVGEGSLQETRENGKTDSWLLRGMPAGEAVRAQTSWGRFQDDSGYTTGLGQRIIPISSDSIQRGSQEGRQGQRQWVRRIRKEAGSMRVQSNKCKQVSPHLGWRIALVHGPAQGGLRASGGRAKVLAAQVIVALEIPTYAGLYRVRILQALVWCSVPRRAAPSVGPAGERLNGRDHLPAHMLRTRCILFSSQINYHVLT
ncbi:hypothetical protein DFH07DRAFT_936680 [Mycena maculata]|uniref:Uncharacterized protein n=1 Tax=Mycena maculata TaxID=230809 RepID=A0AAD7K3R2_9AGAR|nr:hypothetical protein DFH07DRAFT_936680 [Mycena maculata]